MTKGTATPGYTSEYAPEYPQEDPPDTPYHPLEEGPLAIAGTVVNEAGEPVNGIGVVAITRRLYGEQAELLNLGENGRKRTTRTDTSGHFHFQNLADGDYQIQTVAHDYYPLVVNATVRAGINSARLVVVEEREIWVNGFVANTEGQIAAAGGDLFHPLGQAGGLQRRVRQLRFSARCEGRPGSPDRVPVRGVPRAEDRPYTK